MPLINMWRADRESVLSLSLEQVVTLAGDGQLKDNSETSAEFRLFLKEIEGEKLTEFANYCLENAFTNSGQILQDIVNEIGRRLGYQVENGRYQGVRNEIGFDGILSISGENTVVEVKTTNAYVIKLDVIAKYRDRLFEESRIKQNSPILIVVGRDDTQSLEFQVRGSQHAWSMRIISIESLSKLMEVNINSQSSEVTDKIHQLLKPFDYTRLDKIVDVIFTTAEDRKQIVEIDLDAEEDTVKNSQERTSKDILTDKKELAIKKLSEKLGHILVKRKHSLYSDQGDAIHAVVAISKQYERSEKYYWYAYHNTPHRSFLSETKEGYMVFGMADTDISFAIPYQELEKIHTDLYSTVKDTGREYKHIYIHVNNKKFTLRTKSGKNIDLSLFLQ